MNTEQKEVTGACTAKRIPNALWYAGLQRHSGNYIVFRSRRVPTEKTHAALSFCFGPYKTHAEASEVAQYQGYGRVPEGAAAQPGTGGLMVKAGSIL